VAIQTAFTVASFIVTAGESRRHIQVTAMYRN
jgi:hypothetical protein